VHGPNNADNFSKTLMEVGSKMGIRIKPPKMVGLPNDRTDTYVNRIRDEINSSVIYSIHHHHLG
jgi:hypothetical protein